MPYCKTEDCAIFNSTTSLGWGCHSPLYKLPYLTAASTLGMEKADVDFFIKKLDECLKMLKKPRTD